VDDLANGHGGRVAGIGGVVALACSDGILKSCYRPLVGGNSCLSASGIEANVGKYRTGEWTWRYSV
jgi:hypothetical protein